MLGMPLASSISDKFICLVKEAYSVPPLCGNGRLSQIKIDPTEE